MISFINLSPRKIFGFFLMVLGHLVLLGMSFIGLAMAAMYTKDLDELDSNNPAFLLCLILGAISIFLATLIFYIPSIYYMSNSVQNFILKHKQATCWVLGISILNAILLAWIVVWPKSFFALFTGLI